VSGIPILMYHEVTSPDRIAQLSRKIQRGYITAAQEFEAQIRALMRGGFEAISLSALIAGFEGRGTLPRNPIVITFDDGYEGNFTYARPILRQYNASATFFVVSNKIGDDAMMSWSQLRVMAEDGFEIQSHTANHPLLSTLDADATLAELRDSKFSIETNIHRHVNLVSLPNGDSNPFLRERALACDYAAACGSTFGFNDRDTDRFALRRIAVKAGMELRAFERIVTQEPTAMRRLRWQAHMKATVARALGKKNYDRIYNLVYRVEEQDKRKRS
jgi:peptidoglycan/xylan/chitin deacetylase (PgdA/CDA1 family)